MTSVGISKVLSTNTVAADSAVTSAAVNVSLASLFAVKVVLTGTGTAKVNYTVGLSSDDTFVTPDDDGQTTAGLIADSLTVGTYYYSFIPALAPWIKISVTEIGKANAVVASVWLIYK